MRITFALARAMSTAGSRSPHTSYPKWLGPSQCPEPVVEKPARPRPLGPSPSAKCPNSLPSRPATASPQGFKSSRHIIPAAFPRTYLQSTGTLERESDPFTQSPRSEEENKEQRKQRNLEEARECVKARFGATITTKDNDTQSGLWIAGERWIRTEGERDGEGLTLVLSAANGFTKEVCHPDCPE